MTAVVASPPPRTRLWLWLAACAAAVAVFAARHALEDSHAPDALPVDGYVTPLGEVPRVDAVGRGTFVRDILGSAERASRPAVVEGSDVLSWPALRLWTPEYVSERMPRDTLLEVAESDAPLFVYYNEDALLKARFFAPAWSPPHRKRRASAADFWRAARSESRPYQYLSLHLDDQFELRRDLGPGVAGERDGDDQKLTLWMGTRGVTAQTHYDTYRNFYVQVHGTKRFLLSPPSQLRRARLFPWVHPHQRQSSLCFAGGRELAGTQRGGGVLEALDVTLRPGEVLYLPPFWMHRVVAVNDSISVSTWTPSPEQAAKDEALAAPLPFDDGWGGRRTVAALRAFLRAVADGAGADPRELVEQRYVPQFGRAPARQPCGFLRQGGALPWEEACAGGEAGEEDASRARDRAADVARLLSRVSDNDVRVTVTFDYIEQVAFFVLGPRHVNPFLQLCLQQAALVPT